MKNPNGAWGVACIVGSTADATTKVVPIFRIRRSTAQYSTGPATVVQDGRASGIGILQVGANPSAFSEYTVQFARLFGEHWEIPNNPLEFLSLSDEMKWAWFNRDRAVSRVAQ